MIPSVLKIALTTSQYDTADTQEVIVIKYQTLVHTRHDTIHHLVNEMLMLPNVFGHNNFLSDEFGEFMPEEISKYSPDIVKLSGCNVFIADISCSWNEEYNLSEKHSKYDQIIDWVNTNTEYTAHPLVMVWVKPDLSNLSEMIDNLYVTLGRIDMPFLTISTDKMNEVLSFFENVSNSIEILKNMLPFNVFQDHTYREKPKQKPDIEKLIKISQEKFAHYDSVKDSCEASTLENVIEMAKRCLDDTEVYNSLADCKHDDSSFTEAFNFLENVETSYPKGHCHPTFFIPYSDFNSDVLECLTYNVPVTLTNMPLQGKLKKEQYSIMSFLCNILCANVVLKKEQLSFFQTLYKNLQCILDKDGELNMFNTGTFTGSFETEQQLNRLYKEFRDKKDSSVSKRTFFKQNLESEEQISDVLPYAYRNKCIRMSAKDYRLNPFIIQAGTSYKQTHEIRQYKEKTTISQEQFQNMESFLDLLEERTGNISKTHPFLGTDVGVDSPEFRNIKSQVLGNHRNFLAYVQSTHAHCMSRHNMLASTQLLHFNEMNTTDSTFYVFNNGRPNCIHLVQGGSIRRGSDTGQAFMTLMVTHDIRWANSVYGDCQCTPFLFKGKQLYLIITPWVRLNCERLSFMKDQYYSTLSTAYDTWSRSDNPSQRGFFRHMYTFRVCISMAPSQKIAELLMDTRYIIMASISKYSNVFELIKEKFAPPYKNCLEQFIVRQLKKKCKEIVSFLKDHPIRPNKPGYSGTERQTNTLGGDFVVPSLWADCVLSDLQEVFDDIFVYVHTSKEPSSVYHEQVKAINTILTFQHMYDKLDTNTQAGIHTFETLKKWLLSGTKLGCWCDAVFQGSKLYSNKYKNLYQVKDFKEQCVMEPLSELVSTKACIPEIDRVINSEKKTKKRMKAVLANLGTLFSSRQEEFPQPSLMDTYFKLDVDLENEKYLVVSRSLRVKVHDALIDWMSKHPNAETVSDLAVWNIFENNCRVIADTCIKAQYGAKREFYVINLGAKAMARVLENSYKVLAIRSNHEMISVPGDRKFEYIQSAVNDVILASERKQDKMFNVNGDCTKWSACETMSSFLSMSFGLINTFGADATAINNAIICSWACKEIQIPQTILQNLHFMSDTTNYITESTTIHSTQNFLQGMFNYTSSVKAVIATEFSLFLFTQIFPTKFISLSHLEHSDDYTLIVRVNDDKTFEDYRVLHKLTQRFFGINDSTKKTNVQKCVLEFISLFSFNGQLYYPLIKKTKEVGTNLPCTDFRGDIMNVQSRVSEAIRMGVSIDSAYFMKRVHCASIADAYSLTPGMKNGCGTVSECFSRPFEMFGFPDCLPIFDHLCNGSPEYYRLYNFGGQKIKRYIQMLYKLGIDTFDVTDETHSYQGDVELGFYNPTFSYPIKINKVKLIKEKLGITFEQTLEYFNNNYADMFVKPIESKRFLKWMKSMYCNKSFVKAYMRVSRSAMVLRHSLFSSKACILHPECVRNRSGEFKFVTIPKFLDYLEQLSANDPCLSDESVLNMEKEINCYTNILHTCYTFIQGMTVLPVEFYKPKATIQRTPSAISWLKLENRIESVLQYLVNKENFISDRRQIYSEVSLYRDVNRLKDHYDIQKFSQVQPYTRHVFKELKAQTASTSYSLVFVTDDQTVLGYFKQYLALNLQNQKTYKLVPSTITDLSAGLPMLPPAIKDWQTVQTSYEKTLNQVALVYRAIVLTHSDITIEENCARLKDRAIPMLNCTVEDFFQKMSLDTLISLHVGENTKKIYCFLKAKLFGEMTDLNKFVTGELFYEFSYLNRHQVVSPFTEAAYIKFKGVIGKAHFYKSNVDTCIILELPPVNRIVWFYMYTIAQRVFGVISQTVFDLKMSESMDLAINKMSEHQQNLIQELSFTRTANYYMLHGTVILPCKNPSIANIPIIEHNVRFYPKFARKSQFGNFYSVTLTDLQVLSGNVMLFKLPFGNLSYEDVLSDVLESESDIQIDNLPFQLIKSRQWLKKFLISSFDGFVDPGEVKKHFPRVVTACKKIRPKEYVDLDLFPTITDLNVITISNVSKQEHIPSMRSEPIIELEAPLSFNFTPNFGSIQLDFPTDDEEKDDIVYNEYDLIESEMPVISEMSESDLLSMISMPSFNMPNITVCEPEPVQEVDTGSGDLPEEMLLSLFKSNVSSFEPIEEEFVPEQSLLNLNITSSISLQPDMEQNIPQYELVSKTKKEEYNAFIEEKKQQIIEESRDTIQAWSIPEVELGELFQPLLLDVIEPEQLSSSSSSDNSVHELSIDHFQMVPNITAFEGSYNFEKKCRENILPLPIYLTRLWCKVVAEEIVSNARDLHLFLRLIATIKTHEKSLKLGNENKSVISAILNEITDILKSTNDIYFFSKQSALKWENNKLKFVRIGMYSTASERDQAVSKKSFLHTPTFVHNVNLDVYWAYTDLKQNDLTRILSQDFSTDDKFHNSNPMLSIFDAVFTFACVLDSDSDNEYDF